jgi:hypothetical protein
MPIAILEPSVDDDELLDTPLPGLMDICSNLLTQDGIDAVIPGRQAGGQLKGSSRLTLNLFLLPHRLLLLLLLILLFLLLILLILLLLLLPLLLLLLLLLRLSLLLSLLLICESVRVFIAKVGHAPISGRVLVLNDPPARRWSSGW